MRLLYLSQAKPHIIITGIKKRIHIKTQQHNFLVSHQVNKNSSKENLFIWIKKVVSLWHNTQISTTIRAVFSKVIIFFFFSLNSPGKSKKKNSYLLVVHSNDIIFLLVYLFTYLFENNAIKETKEKHDTLKSHKKELVNCNTFFVSYKHPGEL